MRMSGCRVHMLCGNQSYSTHRSHYLSTIAKEGDNQTIELIDKNNSHEKNYLKNL